jgi:tRNA threonylcarbamoyladenosine biosynthesis protein TsaE
VNEEVTVATAADMRALGRRLAAVLGAGDLVILTGPLGAGKTTLTQGIGAGLGIRGPVTSPTFVIARVHPPLAAAPARAGLPPGWCGPAGQRPALVHADAYRLGNALELDDLDLDADAAASVTVVEWGEGLAEGLAEDRLEITIVPGPADPAEEPAGDPAEDPGEDPAEDAAGDPAGDPGEEGPQDSPRTVRVRGIGARWEDIQLPPAAVADRL